MHIKKTTAILVALLQFGQSFSSSLTKGGESSSTARNSQHATLLPPPYTPPMAATSTSTLNSGAQPWVPNSTSTLNSGAQPWVPNAEGPTSLRGEQQSTVTPMNVVMNRGVLEQTEKQALLAGLWQFSQNDLSSNNLFSMIKLISKDTVECEKLKLDETLILLSDLGIMRDDGTHDRKIFIGQLTAILSCQKLLVHLIEQIIFKEIIKDDRPSEVLEPYKFKARGASSSIKGNSVLLLSPKGQKEEITEKQNEIIKQMFKLHKKYTVVSDQVHNNHYLLKFENQEDAELYMSLRNSSSTDRYFFSPLITFEHPKDEEPSSTTRNSQHLVSLPPYGLTAATSNSLGIQSQPCFPIRNQPQPCIPNHTPMSATSNPSQSDRVNLAIGTLIANRAELITASTDTFLFNPCLKEWENNSVDIDSLDRATFTEYKVRFHISPDFFKDLSMLPERKALHIGKLLSSLFDRKLISIKNIEFTGAIGKREITVIADLYFHNNGQQINDQGFIIIPIIQTGGLLKIKTELADSCNHHVSLLKGANFIERRN